MKTIIIVTDKSVGKYRAFSVLSKAAKDLKIPYQTIANAMTGGRSYESDIVKIERLEIIR